MEKLAEIKKGMESLIAFINLAILAIASIAISVAFVKLHALYVSNILAYIRLN